MSLLFLIAAIVLAVIVALLPVKIAAGLMGAKRTTFGACLVAVILSLVVNAVAGRMFHYGAIVSALLTGLAYMAVLDTTYVRGVLIALLQSVIVWLLALLLAALGFVALMPVLGHGAQAAGAGWV